MNNKIKVRNSIFELGRIISLIFVMTHHLNGYTQIMPIAVSNWGANFAVLMFALLSGYFFFNNPKQSFKEINYHGKKMIISENSIFRKSLSRIILWIILGNLFFTIFYFSGGNAHLSWMFDDDNWYIYHMLFISIIGVFVQKIYTSLKNDSPLYALVFIGTILFLVGYFVVDIDANQFRLWRIGMMIAGLGGGALIAKISLKSKLFLSLFVFLVATSLLAVKLTNNSSSSLFPLGSSMDWIFFNFLSTIALFTLMTTLTIRLRFINWLAIHFQYALETNWMTIYLFEVIFFRSFASHDLNMLIVMHAIIVPCAAILAFGFSYFRKFIWDKYVEKYLFIAFEWIFTLPRIINKYDKFITKRNELYIQIYKTIANIKLNKVSV